MKPSLIKTLATIGEKPTVTKRDTLTITRRVLRHVCQKRANLAAERRALRREANKLRRFLPFTALAVADLEQQASDHGAESLAALRNVLEAYGRAILSDSEGIADGLGFDQLADLLSINPAHREQAKRDGGDTLQGLAYIAGMEDSATGHNDQWGSGGPLFEACHATMISFIRACPEHLLPDPFAPGEVFGPKLPPQLRVV